MSTSVSKLHKKIMNMFFHRQQYVVLFWHMPHIVNPIPYWIYSNLLCPMNLVTNWSIFMILFWTMFDQIIYEFCIIFEHYLRLYGVIFQFCNHSQLQMHQSFVSFKKRCDRSKIMKKTTTAPLSWERNKIDIDIYIHLTTREKCLTKLIVFLMFGESPSDGISVSENTHL